MDNTSMAPFEKQFEKQPPTRIGAIYLGTNETAAVFIDDGWVTVPVEDQNFCGSKDPEE